MKSDEKIVIHDPWEGLKEFTDARIGLGRCGTSLPISEVLDFKLAHAKARDAVLQPMQTEKMIAELAADNIASFTLSSSVESRSEYLTRPDKGRCLSEDSKKLLAEKAQEVDVCLVVGDGLSSRAIHENGIPYILSFLSVITKSQFTISPVCFVDNCRVAIADEIAFFFKAKLSVILIGERPGLSSPNSLGIYLTYKPTPGTTDESRNCISNIRTGGLSITDGVQKLSYLIENAFIQKESGVYLKDKMEGNYLPFGVNVGSSLV
ncbi:MAG: ethanolamine ammonia-lyase subunit EutC [Desulfotalea sp.]